jgi:hypothetical protein
LEERVGMILAVSSGTAVVGWFLIVVGGICVVVGAIAGARELLKAPAVTTASLGDVIGALLKAGPWGVMMAAGLAMFAAGCALVGIKLDIPSG